MSSRGCAGLGYPKFMTDRSCDGARTGSSFVCIWIGQLDVDVDVGVWSIMPHFEASEINSHLEKVRS